MTKQEAAEVIKDYYDNLKNQHQDNVKKDPKVIHNKTASYLWVEKEAVEYGRDWDE